MALLKPVYFTEKVYFTAIYIDTHIFYTLSSKSKKRVDILTSYQSSR